MAEDQLLDFSGELPEDVRLFSKDVAVDSESELLANLTTVVFNLTTTSTTSTLPITTTLAPLLPYTPNPFRIGFLAVKCLLILLLCVLTCTIRRDYLKVFAICMLVPLFLEAGFDVFTEIQAGTGVFGTQKFEWTYYMVAAPPNATITDLPKHAITSYGAILQQYSTYQLYTGDELFALVSFVLGDYVFWSLLFSTSTAFFFAHKAVVRPEKVIYQPVVCTFLKMQLVAAVFTACDTLLAIYQVPNFVYATVMVTIRLSACLEAIAILTQILASIILFCRPTHDFAVTSPYEQIRHGKLRLFLLILFAIVVHTLTLPYIVWAAVSLTRDVFWLLSFSTTSLPTALAAELFPLHLTLFLVRPFVFLLATIALINPYRRRFTRHFCPCCRPARKNASRSAESLEMTPVDRG